MASNLKLPDAFRETRALTWAAKAGSGALLRIYSGSQPTDADTAIGAQTLLAELVCATPFAPAASSEGVVTVGTITEDSVANNSGTAAFFRLVKADGTTVVCDGSVGTSGADLNLITTTIVAGQPVRVTSFVITEGGA